MTSSIARRTSSTPEPIPFTPSQPDEITPALETLAKTMYRLQKFQEINSDNQKKSHHTTSVLSSEKNIFAISAKNLLTIFAFLPEAGQAILTSTSKKIDRYIWNAHILQKMPHVYPLYRQTNQIPCQQHYELLCDSQERLKSYFDQQSRSDRALYGPIPFGHLMMQMIFPDSACMYIPHPYQFAQILGGSFIYTVMSIEHKLDNMFYASGMLEDRQFFVIGEEHMDPYDQGFLYILHNACSKNQIALFCEGINTSNPFNPLNPFESFITSNLPHEAVLKGLEAPDFMPLVLQSLVLNLHFLRTPVPSDYVIEFFGKMIRLLSGSHTGIEILKYALDYNTQTFSDKTALCKAISAAIAGRWTQLEQGDTPFSKESLDNIRDTRLKDLPSTYTFLASLIFSFILKGKNLFTETEMEALKRCTQDRSIEATSAALEIFFEKREKDFVKNILSQLSSIPPSLPIVISLGQRHLRYVFSLLQSEFYKLPNRKLMSKV